MIKLSTKIVTRYKCDFCKRVYVIYKRGVEHEFKCYKNPDRHCITCDDTGVEFVMGGSPEGGVTEVEIDCWACERAREAGGKSYLKDNNLLPKGEME